jgi:hypothetical protein
VGGVKAICNANVQHTAADGLQDLSVDSHIAALGALLSCCSCRGSDFAWSNVGTDTDGS